VVENLRGISISVFDWSGDRENSNTTSSDSWKVFLGVVTNMGNFFNGFKINSIIFRRMSKTINIRLWLDLGSSFNLGGWCNFSLGFWFNFSLVSCFGLGVRLCLFIIMWNIFGLGYFITFFLMMFFVSFLNRFGNFINLQESGSDNFWGEISVFGFGFSLNGFNGAVVNSWS